VKSSKPAHAAAIASVPVAKEIEPVILTRAALDDKIVTLRVAARIATSIRLPEPVNSVVVGDTENFQAEHSEHEPELVTVKPMTAEPVQTNVLITTTRGHQVNLLLISSGEGTNGPETVDVLLRYCWRAARVGRERHDLQQCTVTRAPCR
jgi:type IV secretory pathway VirB9-like protein